MITVYFKPDCSTCNTTGCLLEERNIEFKKIEYLNTPPSKEELRSILKKLGIPAEELVRKKEPVYQQNYAGRSLSEEEWIDAMLAHPILIERPILWMVTRPLFAGLLKNCWNF
jgi:arsenate reductase